LASSITTTDYYILRVSARVEEMTELEIFMEGLEGGINSSKGPPWKWDKVVMVMEEAKRIGEKPGAPYPVTQEAWETGWCADVARATGSGRMPTSPLNYLRMRVAADHH
jgi:hypothetical protein